MNRLQDNSTSSKRIRHNPKIHAPALYIPIWLIQVPVKKLSHGAKILYGRLSQWSNERGDVFRTVYDLSLELGMCESSVEKFLKELKDNNLIGIFHPQAGGINHYEFYDHEWMYEPIREQLVYKNDKFDPPYNHTAPSVSSYGTPPYNHTDINIIEIKEIKDTHSAKEVDEKEYNLEKALFSNPEQKRKAIFFREQCRQDAKVKSLYESLRAKGLDKSFEDVVDECVSYYGSKENPELINPQRLLNWLNREELPKHNPAPKYVPKEQRANEYEQIARREREAEESKRQEIEASKGFKQLVQQACERLSLPERMKRFAEDRLSLGMSLMDYHNLLLQGVR